MKIVNGFTTTAIAVLISTSLWAQENTQPSTSEATAGNTPMDPLMMQNMMKMRQQQMAQRGSMPMMQGGNNQMMDPVMMQNMMRMHQQQMKQGGNMPMMGGGGNREMMMDPMMRENMMRMRQQKMRQGQHGGMMNPQMMQSMMQMKQQHMQKMDRRLSNIESMLSELLQRQKGK